MVKKSSKNIKHIILCRGPLFLIASSEKWGISTEIRESTALENSAPIVINAQKVKIQLETKEAIASLAIPLSILSSPSSGRSWVDSPFPHLQSFCTLLKGTQRFAGNLNGIRIREKNQNPMEHAHSTSKYRTGYRSGCK